MKKIEHLSVWFITGSQHLYGDDTLRQVDEHSKEIINYVNSEAGLPVTIIYKPVVTTPEEIQRVCLDANSDPECIGLITWMHTFSPAKMWIQGLCALQKPFMQLHTQYNREIPWDTIDMDFMNLNQTAHGGREFGFIGSRLRKERKVVVGHWQDKDVHEGIDAWVRAAWGVHESRGLKVARFGDNMREVAVTEGDKVEAQKVFGYSVNGYGMGDLVARINEFSPQQVAELVDVYKADYLVSETVLKDQVFAKALQESARIELGMRAFLEDGGFKAFTTTFENLHGIEQLPGLAVQRLMQSGYGFGAEGDWKTAALVRIMKVMSNGLEGGTSFMEDYTYHLDSLNMRVLGAHMLEVCPSIAESKPKLEVHPLSIGGKQDPPRLVFNTPAGTAINVSIMDMGARFRVLVNEVEVVPAGGDLPHLPVARVVWKPLPDLKTAAAAWILSGGAHHTAFSMALHTEHMRDFAEMIGLEYVSIDKDTDVYRLKNELRWNDLYYHLARGI